MAKYFDWFESGDDTLRGVDFGDMRGVDKLTPGGIEREIVTPYGKAKSFIPAAPTKEFNQLVGQSIPTPVKPKLPVKEAAMPAAAPVALGAEFIPQIPQAAPTPVAPPTNGLYEAPKSPAPVPFRTPRVDGRQPVDATAMPRIFNPLAFDPKGATQMLGDSEPGAQKLADFLKSKGKEGFSIRGHAIRGSTPGKLATDWVNRMKQFRAANDQEGLDQMRNIASYLYGNS